MRWCYKCGQSYPLTEEYWYYVNAKHTRFKTLCKKCANCESKLSHRIHRSMKKELQSK